MTAPAGATAQEWAGWKALGLTADLLPVVSDPGIPISPGSKMKALGKTPSHVNHEGNAAGIAKWTEFQADEAATVRWARHSAHGICLQTRHARAIDVDIEDPAVVAQVRELLELLLGPLPWRTRADSGKALALVLCPDEGEPLTKRAAKVKDGLVELLATGQQCVVAGTHPKGQRYAWLGGVPEQLPVVTQDELLGAFDAVVAMLGGAVQVESAAVVLAQPRRADDAVPDPVADYLWANGWVLEQAQDGKLLVRCPHADQHTSDNGPSQTAWMPAGVGGRDVGGFECRHRSHGKIGTSSFLELIGYGAGAKAEDFEVVGGPAAEPVVAALEPGQVHLQPFETDEPWPNFTRDKKGILTTASNALAGLSRPDFCGARIGYDEFKATTMIEWEDAQGTWRPLRDTDYARLKVRLEKRGFIKPNTDLVREMVGYVAEIHQFDSAIQWITSLQWDGVPRVERFFIDCFGVEDSPYTRAVGRYTWTALAGRAEAPGCKVDMTPVLIGGQGLRKTSGVRAMAPLDDAFVEIALDIHDDNLARKMRGKLVGEIGELRGLQGKDAEAVKQWFTRTHEEWTPKYREHAIRFPRRLLMIGTGNNPEFLEDETGSRRFLPMTVRGRVDTARIAAERDQLWAEGRAMFCAGGHQADWQEAEELAKAEHQHYQVRDDWESLVTDWLARDPMEGFESPTRAEGFVKSVDVLTGAIGLQPARISKREQMRVGKLLTTLGYEKSMKWEGGTNVRGWVKKAAGDAAGFA